MRHTLPIMAVALGLFAAAPAAAECSKEVALAINSLGKYKYLRKETNMITESGPVKMVVEYDTPHRMRQIVTPLAGGPTTEAIVVEDKAWTNSGDGWTEMSKRDTAMVIQYMIKSIAQVYQEVGKFECVGIETVDGQRLRAYRGINPENQPPPQGLEGMADMESTATRNEAVRMVYLDVDTGRPVRSILAREGHLDKPLFQEIYSYPEKVEIEPPTEVVQN